MMSQGVSSESTFPMLLSIMHNGPFENVAVTLVDGNMRTSCI